MPRSYVQPEDTTMTKSKDVLVLLDLTLGGNETVSGATEPTMMGRKVGRAGGRF